jgi:hypothetical protein
MHFAAAPLKSSGMQAKAAPTIKPTLKILNLIYIRKGLKQETTAATVFSG